MQFISETITSGPQQNVSGTSDNVGFFPYGWPAYSIIQPGWTCVQTGAVVTVVDAVNLVITTVGTPFTSGSTYTFTGPTGVRISGGVTIRTPPPPRPTLVIPTNDGGGLTGWNTNAAGIPYSPTVIATYPVGSTITFQDSTTATITQWDDYGPTYIDIFWDTPKTGTIFPITLSV
jgi:hypothetical protein